LVGQTTPCIPGFVRLAGGDSEDVDLVPIEGLLDLVGVDRADVGVGDYRVAVGRRDLLRDRGDMRNQTGGDPDRRRTEPDPLMGGRGRGGGSFCYQVTSPAPVRTLASRASVKSRSDSRLR
jgi:hypothetical protein